MSALPRKIKLATYLESRVTKIRITQLLLLAVHIIASHAFCMKLLGLFLRERVVSNVELIVFGETFQRF